MKMTVTTKYLLSLLEKRVRKVVSTESVWGYHQLFFARSEEVIEKSIKGGKGQISITIDSEEWMKEYINEYNGDLTDLTNILGLELFEILVGEIGPEAVTNLFSNITSEEEFLNIMTSARFWGNNTNYPTGIRLETPWFAENNVEAWKKTARGIIYPESDN